MNSDQQTLFRLGSRNLRRMLTLQDRNPHSPTYGSFDRNFWHLRIKDFPSGMAQEFVLPLALAYAHEFSGNTFCGSSVLLEWIRAGIAYAQKSAHADGSCDDYYPFEKAAGAAAFSQYAILEALNLTGLSPQPFLPFLEQRALWLGHHLESGRLSNHEALIANILFRTAALTGKSSFFNLGRKRLERLLSWQSEEGWFYEYQGCDPGYLTMTIGNLAEIDERHPEFELRPALTRAVRFLHDLQPPDGWLGGEWTSRNTNNYFPHGIEMCGAWLPDALAVNRRAVAALSSPPEYDDDHILGHHAWSYLKAAVIWKDHAAEPVPQSARAYPEAGFMKQVKGDWTLLVSTKKGGTFRLYHQDRLRHSDTGVSLLVGAVRKPTNYVCHLWSEDHAISSSDDEIVISGRMAKAKSSQMTPIKNIILRGLMLTVGRYNPDLVRRLLQDLLIVGKSAAPFAFERRLVLSTSGLEVSDRVTGEGDIIAAGVGPAQSSIYTVMSRVFHAPQMQPWTDLMPRVRTEDGERLKVTRYFGINA